MKKSCESCQYFREGKWCSNSKSVMFRVDVSPNEWCDNYTKRGEKAPLWMRMATKLMSKIK